MPYGYTGKILHANLTTSELSVEQPEEKFYRTYMGGSAMGMHYVLKETPAGVEPLSPENVLSLCTGVVTGTPISGQSRLTSVAKSPLEIISSISLPISDLFLISFLRRSPVEI